MLPQAPRVAMIANVAFDVSVQEMLMALLNGGSLICTDYTTLLDTRSLAALFDREQVAVATFPPTLLKQCLADNPDIIRSLDILYTTGDRLDGRDAVEARSLVKTGFYNAYGPTETHICTLFHINNKADKFVNGVPIGRAVSQCGAFVVDAKQQLVPFGVMGELVITGDALARGYTDDAQNTNRFIQMTVGGKLVRAYRTGDRVRWRATDGQIEFFGRMDQQLKIRGHRIEPAEVERAMLRVNLVRDAALVIRKNKDEDPEMIGFITARDGDTVDKGSVDYESWRDDWAARTEKEVRKELQTQLPSYMIPTRIVVLDQMPVNANRKADRQELAQRARTVSLAPRTATILRVAPRNDVEALLCEEFGEVLGVEVGITDSFFDLGGHLLLAMKLVARLSKRLDSHVAVRDVFDHPTIADLAGTIERGSAPHAAIPSTVYTGPVAQSFAQGRLWFLEQFNLGASWYSMPLAARLHGPVNIDALSAALRALEQRHETLRTTFEEQDGVGVQVVGEPQSKGLRVIDVSKHNGGYAQALHEEQTAPLDLASEPGWKVSLLRLGEEDHILSIVMHHIISDGWSLDILRQELGQFYKAAAQGVDPLSQIDPLPIQYRDFALWQKQDSQVAEQERQLGYWTKQLADSSPAEFLSDRPRPTVLSGDAGMVRLTIEGSVFEKLQSFCQANKTTVFVVLLAAFRAVHYRLTGAEDATIGTPIANRNRPELENIIGFLCKYTMYAHHCSRGRFIQCPGAAGSIGNRRSAGESRCAVRASRLVSPARVTRDIKEPVGTAAIRRSHAKRPWKNSA